MERKTNRNIILVEDNSDDLELTLRALKQHNIRNEIVVVRDGAEALDYLFATGAYADRDASAMPAVVILDLKLPKVDGLEVLQRMRADERPDHADHAVEGATKAVHWTLRACVCVLGPVPGSRAALAEAR